MAARRSVMFSPILAIVSEIDSATVMLPAFAALSLLTSVPTDNATSAIILTRPWNRSLRATKSVSELTSTTTPFVPWTSKPIRPSAATRPAFLAALDRPFFRSQSCAAVKSPSVSLSAALQSIMPAPVDSRSSLTICALIFAITFSSIRHSRACSDHTRLRTATSVSRAWPAKRTDHTTPRSLRGQFLGLADPAVDAARQTDLFADTVGGLFIECGDLRIVEDAKIVELLFDRRRNTGQLFEIVGDAARAGQRLESEIAERGCCRHLLRDDRLFGSADIDAHLALRARNSVDRSLCDEIAVQRDSTASIVVTRNGKSDAGRIAIRVDDRGNRNVEALRLLDGDVFLVGIDDEQQVGHATHVLNAAKRAVELVTLALHREALFLGVAAGLVRCEHLVELAQARDRTRNCLPVGQRAAEPARIHVILRAAFGRVGDRVLRLAFGADEQDAAAFRDGVADRLQRAMQHRHSLGEIDDVNVVAGAEDVRAHLRVRTVGLMAEMDASFQKLAHRKVRKRHNLLRLIRRGRL